jgi:hypothetical protein
MFGMNHRVARVKGGKNYRVTLRPHIYPIISFLDIDGAATRQFADLPVTPLRFTLGIFGRKAHDRPHFWRTVGYVPIINGDKSQGVRRFHESGHVESLMMDVANDEGVFGGDDVEKAQDLHTILAVLLKEYLYKGQVYKDIEFLLYIHFIKCNTEEADQATGQ